MDTIEAASASSVQRVAAMFAATTAGVTPLQCATLSGGNVLELYLERLERFEQMVCTSAPADQSKNAAIVHTGIDDRTVVAAVITDLAAAGVPCVPLLEAADLCRVIEAGADTKALALYFDRMGVSSMPPLAVLDLFTTPCMNDAGKQTTAWMSALTTCNPGVMQHVTKQVFAAVHIVAVAQQGGHDDDDDADNNVLLSGQEQDGHDHNSKRGKAALWWSNLLTAQATSESLAPLHVIASDASLLELLSGAGPDGTPHLESLQPKEIVAMLTQRGAGKMPSPLAYSFQHGSQEAVNVITQRFRMAWSSLEDVSSRTFLRRVCLHTDSVGENLLQKAAQNSDPVVLEEALALILELGFNVADLSRLCGGRTPVFQHILQHGSRTSMRRFGMLLLPRSTQSYDRQQCVWTILTRPLKNGQSALDAALLREPHICESYFALLHRGADRANAAMSLDSTHRPDELSVREYLLEASCRRGLTVFARLHTEARRTGGTEETGAVKTPSTARVCSERPDLHAESVDCVQLLFDTLEQADFTTEDYQRFLTAETRGNQTPLHGILRSGSADLVERVASAAARAGLDSQSLQRWLTAPARSGVTPLHQVLHSGNAASVQQYFAMLHESSMLEASVYLGLLTEPTESGMTPLHSALMAGDDDTLQAYLDALGDAGISDATLFALLTGPMADQSTPLSLVAEHGTLATFRWYLGALKEACKSDDAYEGVLTGTHTSQCVPLHALLRRSNKDILDEYLAAVTRLELTRKQRLRLLTWRNTDGFSPLHHAAAHCSLPVIKTLVDAIRELGENVLLDNLACRTRFG